MASAHHAPDNRSHGFTFMFVYLILRYQIPLAKLRVINSPHAESQKRFRRTRMFVEKSPVAAAATGRVILAALAILLSSAIGQAASVVIDEAGMNAIFSQDSFGDTPVSIRFNPSRQIVAPELLVIDSVAKLQALYSLATDPAPTVTAFFVDELDVCVGVEVDVNGEYSGCAQLPGRIMVEDFHAAELTPAILMAHELGHNSNLEHDRFGGLMSLFPPMGRNYSKSRSQPSCRARWSRRILRVRGLFRSRR